MRRIVGLLGAALALDVAALGSREFDADRVQTTRQEARRAAVAAGQRASAALLDRLSELKSKADNAGPTMGSPAGHEEASPSSRRT